ncbi:MAG: hypothetical protein EOO16_00155 [Chitinophagaceae bacterium]|nr:MAG: hypothetical protein EOO16_00155 [Chitinophagaceae bacterium]
MFNKHLFFRLGLLNLAIVALLGLALRLKILLELPFVDYRNLLSAHSHFAFSGWVGFMLMTVFTFDLLSGDPTKQQQKPAWLLLAVNISALGMAATFPFQGYGPLSLFFSSAYILLNFVFARVFIRRLPRSAERPTRLLSTWSVGALLFSAFGPAGLSYILSGRSHNANLYRDAIYWFLHFQYNGFFTLGIFAHLFSRTFPAPVPGDARRFAGLLCASLLPALFLALLWHNEPLFYAAGALGTLLLLGALCFFVKLAAQGMLLKGMRTRLGRRLLRLSFLSFGLKLLLQCGTLIPSLGNAVYGDRPVIIGFLHLVFLGFVSFYLLALLAEEGYFTPERRMPAYPVYVFAAGVFANEILLMLQGLSVLLGANSNYFNWALLGASFLLFAGAALLAGFAWRWRAK